MMHDNSPLGIARRALATAIMESNALIARGSPVLHRHRTLPISIDEWRMAGSKGVMDGIESVFKQLGSLNASFFAAPDDVLSQRFASVLMQRTGSGCIVASRKAERRGRQAPEVTLLLGVVLCASDVSEYVRIIKGLNFNPVQCIALLNVDVDVSSKSTIESAGNIPYQALCEARDVMQVIAMHESVPQPDRSYSDRAFQILSQPLIRWDHGMKRERRWA